MGAGTEAIGGDVVPMPRRRRLYRLQFGEAASLRLITWGALRISAPAPAHVLAPRP
jgi:hypothetical protein